MDSDANDEVVIDAPPFVRVYKSGRIERLVGTEVLPAGLDPATGVASKDVLVDPVSNLTARLYLPDLSGSPPDKKIPVLVYYHGGGFVIETAFSPTYHNYLNSLVAAAGVVAVSVDYRRAPEHPPGRVRRLVGGAPVGGVAADGGGVACGAWGSWARVPGRGQRGRQHCAPYGPASGGRWAGRRRHRDQRVTAGPPVLLWGGAAGVGERGSQGEGVGGALVGVRAPGDDRAGRPVDRPADGGGAELGGPAVPARAGDGGGEGHATEERARVPGGAEAERVGGGGRAAGDGGREPCLPSHCPQERQGVGQAAGGGCLPQLLSSSNDG
ncbi:Carboxylesterase family [Musa troglodytarum]|uniref:Carboxylesterase family n=1 Tax=Musa troglodytarum TaxID=320322 RepID=A0A9E7FYL8_9LILI|nr:Carboxylesterase family [Musa troglodytarum]URE05522.1 Carboxylesterase family [Musa troglodytarum]